MIWHYESGNWILWPAHPIGIIHFLGGAFVATVPHSTYQRLLSTLAERGYGIIATPFIIQMDHEAIAIEISQQFNRIYQNLIQKESSLKQLPIYGLGHSMGCKLHLMLSCLSPMNRQGNMFLSFNNFSGAKSIPFADWISDVIPIEFSPSPTKTLNLIESKYQVAQNLLIKFKTDDLDQTNDLASILKQKFLDQVIQTQLPGTHLTPLGQNIPQQQSLIDFPLAEIREWIQQELYRDIHQLEQTLLQWLDQSKSLSLERSN